MLHDGLLVAVREQIYDLLCFCHGSTNHGGRDKTCALIRKHYTWVPKDLVAQFIKACPTCILKKCGHPEPGLLSPPLTTSERSPSIPAPQSSADDSGPKQEYAESPLSSFRDYFNDADGADGPLQDPYPISLPSTPLPGPYSQFIFNTEHVESSTPVDQLKHYNQLPSTSNPLHDFPSMTREVSLYKGLPDGWQYQNIDYRSAYADCVDHQRIARILPYDPSLGRTRPRVPDETDEGSFNFTSVAGISPRAEDYHSQPISPMMGDENSELPIDPLLLALSASMRSQSVEYGSPNSEEIPLSDILRTGSEMDMNSLSPGLDGTENELMGPPASMLESLDSVRTFREFLRIRDTLESGSDSFDQDGVKNTVDLWREGNDGNESGESSPANSVRSNTSGLSLLADGTGTASPASTTGTPFTTAPVTPVDEISSEKGGLRVDEQGECDEEGVDLNEVIQGVSICDVQA